MKDARKWISTLDLVVFGGIPAAISGSMLFTLLTDQAWPPVKIAFAIGVPLCAWLIFSLLLWRKWSEKPTFYTLMGTAVWAKGVPVTDTEVLDAINFYALEISLRYPDLHLPRLLNLFSLLRIEFTKSPIWWGLRKHYGLQSNLGVRVYWNGGFEKNAFFHELNHVVDEMWFNITDYTHQRKDWWNTVRDIQELWSKRP